MKPVRIILLFMLVLAVQPVLAEQEGLMSGQAMNYIGFGAIMLALITLCFAMFVVLKAFKAVEKILLGPEAAQANEAALIAERKAAGQARINKLFSLKPLSEESSLLLEDDYDGIKELDNPTPAWFMYLFYLTI